MTHHEDSIWQISIDTAVVLFVLLNKLFFTKINFQAQGSSPVSLSLLIFNNNIYKNRKARFIQFIRHILGIEILKSFPETVSEAFEQFIREHTHLSSRQLEFLNLLKCFIVEREKVEKKDLINAPFTVIHPQGIRGVFSPAEIEEILQLTESLAAWYDRKSSHRI